MEKSQADMAKDLGIPQRTYANYEKPGARLPVEVLHRLSDLGLNLNWFITRKGEMLSEGVRGFEEISHIQAEHVEQAYILIKEGLGKHKLPITSEGYILGLISENLAQGESQESVLNQFSSLVQRVIEQRRAHHRK